MHFLLDCIITCILRLRWIWEGTSWPVKLSVVLLFPRYWHSIRCSIREINLIYNYSCIFPLFMVNEQLGLNIILFAEKLSLHIQLFSTVKCKPKRRLIVTLFLFFFLRLTFNEIIAVSTIKGIISREIFLGVFIRARLLWRHSLYAVWIQSRVQTGNASYLTKTTRRGYFSLFFLFFREKSLILKLLEALFRSNLTIWPC